MELAPFKMQNFARSSNTLLTLHKVRERKRQRAIASHVDCCEFPTTWQMGAGTSCVYVYVCTYLTYRTKASKVFSCGGHHIGSKFNLDPTLRVRKKRKRDTNGESTRRTTIYLIMQSNESSTKPTFGDPPILISKKTTGLSEDMLAYYYCLRRVIIVQLILDTTTVHAAMVGSIICWVVDIDMTSYSWTGWIPFEVGIDMMMMCDMMRCENPYLHKKYKRQVWYGTIPGTDRHHTIHSTREVWCYEIDMVWYDTIAWVPFCYVGYHLKYTNPWSKAKW